MYVYCIFHHLFLLLPFSLLFTYPFSSDQIRCSPKTPDSVLNRLICCTKTFNKTYSILELYSVQVCFYQTLKFGISLSYIYKYFEYLYPTYTNILNIFILHIQIFGISLSYIYKYLEYLYPTYTNI